MAAEVTPCNSCAGPILRVDVDTMRGPSSLVLTLQQAFDLIEQTRKALALNGIPHHHIPE